MKFTELTNILKPDFNMNFRAKKKIKAHFAYVYNVRKRGCVPTKSYEFDSLPDIEILLRSVKINL